jgi:hypothetical protein
LSNARLVNLVQRAREEVRRVRGATAEAGARRRKDGPPGFDERTDVASESAKARHEPEQRPRRAQRRPSGVPIAMESYKPKEQRQ